MALTHYTAALLNSLTGAGLAPGVTPLIPAGFKPTTKLEVEFPGGKEVQLGNFLKTGETAGVPSITFGKEKEVCYFFFTSGLRVRNLWFFHQGSIS